MHAKQVFSGQATARSRSPFTAVLTLLTAAILVPVSIRSHAQGTHAEALPAAGAPTLTISRQGTRTQTHGAAANFTGAVTVDPLFSPVEPQRATASYVTFAPGARTAWHTHPLGQTLVVTAGTGYVQRWGGPIETIRLGDVVSIKPGEKHWHGGTADSAMTHLAMGERQDGKTVDWLEKVSDEQYGNTR